MGQRSVICETDYLDAYNLVLSTFVASSHQDLVSKIHEFLTRQWNITFLLIEHTANGVADLLAKQAATSQHGLIEWSSPSTDISSLVFKEIYCYGAAPKAQSTRNKAMSETPIRGADHPNLERYDTISTDPIRISTT
ncbi:hypothetical protein PIB30_082202 [Stylosanthes scabra]|uniref:RNase H type-1 domain-containing protein n=1 Tax=Stylosanthes scabra TaxID=79078 RepID=A0ABU6QSS5_9FABA|nr:hypothetical protein [Stylosanthes scabra]